MTTDAIRALKTSQKETWGTFAPLEVVTIIPAATLVKFSGLKPHDNVLDVGCGTGVVAITAARAGAKVSALDISPVLVDRCRTNISLAKVAVDVVEGDAEALPYDDNTFDVVLSQFGHMFAPRPQIVTHEMLRVLKPGGTIAFTVWPEELFVGRVFTLINKYSPLPSGVPCPSVWGDPKFISKQLGNKVTGLTFDVGVMHVPMLSLGHYQHGMEKSLGPLVQLVKDCENDPKKLNSFRAELQQLAAQYYEDNHIHQHYLMARAKK